MLYDNEHDLYVLATIPTVEECVQLGVPRKKAWAATRLSAGEVYPALRVIGTDDYRPPKAGEWYIEVATGEWARNHDYIAYQATTDLEDSYMIGKLILIWIEKRTHILSNWNEGV